MSPNDRMARAEDYVFGLMDEHERERAERDMERDPEFRDCVMVLAERLRQLKSQPRRVGSGPADAWDEISRRIADMPQMGDSVPKNPPRRRTRRFVGRGAHETGGRRGMLVATGIALVFLLGYLAGKL